MITQIMRQMHTSTQIKTCLAIFRDRLPIVNEEHLERLGHVQLHLWLPIVFVLPYHADR